MLVTVFGSPPTVVNHGQIRAQVSIAAPTLRMPTKNGERALERCRLETSDLGFTTLWIGAS